MISCDESGIPDPLSSISSLSLNVPEVTGIILRDVSCGYYGEWGNPSNPGNVFPNPSIGDFIIVFDLPEAMEMNIWVVRAIGPNDIEQQFVDYAGSEIFVPPGAKIATIIDSDRMEAGEHNFYWDGTDDLGHRLPVGFYRIYLRSGELIGRADILLLHNCSYVPYAINVPMCH